jgi:hypothetical protein
MFARSFYLCLAVEILKPVVNMMNPAGPLLSVSPHIPGRDPKLRMATTPLSTLTFGILAELNDQAVRDVLMSMYSVSDPRRYLCSSFPPLFSSH